MSRDEALHQSLASSGAVLVIFIAVCHELVGHIVVPWGPAAFGGPIRWHGLGVLGLGVGVALLVGSLRIVRVPVIPLAVLVVAIGVALLAYAARVHGEFHFFGASLCLAGSATAFFHRKAAALARRPCPS